MTIDDKWIYWIETADHGETGSDIHCKIVTRELLLLVTSPRPEIVDEVSRCQKLELTCRIPYARHRLAPQTVTDQLLDC